MQASTKDTEGWIPRGANPGSCARYRCVRQLGQVNKRPNYLFTYHTMRILLPERVAHTAPSGNTINTWTSTRGTLAILQSEVLAANGTDRITTEATQEWHGHQLSLASLHPPSEIKTCRMVEPQPGHNASIARPPANRAGPLHQCARSVYYRVQGRGSSLLYTL